MSRRYEYKLIEFVNERGDQRSIDIVPTDWIQFDKELGELVTPFIPNASKANLKILTNRVRQRLSPLKSWPMFTVAVKGYADTYDHAEEKIKSLETAPYAFSTDNEDHGQIKELQQKKTYMKGPQNQPLRLPSTVDLSKSLRSSRGDRLAESSFGRDGQVQRRREQPRRASGALSDSDGSSKTSDNSCSTTRRIAPPNTHRKSSTRQKRVSRQLDFESDSEDIPSEKVPNNRTDRYGQKPSGSSQNRTKAAKTSTSSIADNRQPSLIAKDSAQVQTNDVNNDFIFGRDGQVQRRSERARQASDASSESGGSSKASGISRSASKRNAPPNSHRESNTTQKNVSRRLEFESVSEEIPPEELLNNKTDRYGQKPSGSSQHRTRPDETSTSSIARNRQPSLVAKNLTQVETEDVNNNIDTKELIMTCYRKLSAQIARVSGLVADIKIQQDERIMSGNVDNKKPSQSNELQAFIDEQGCAKLPFQSVADFEAFDEKLKHDKSLRDEVMTIMWTLINNKDPVVKPVKDIMKKFMSRDVVRSYTAKKPCGEKKALIATNFGECMKDAILNEYKNRINGSPVKVDCIHRAMGSVINNAKDWEGMRKMRKPMQE